MRLQDVSGDTTRPITDRVKSALFNILGADIEGANFLDLFGGTGSVGIEALSRGAAFVRFIDNHHNAIATIKKNLETTRLKENAQVISADTFSYLRQPADKAFHYIFVAPPQYKKLWQRTLQTLDENPGWMAPDAWVIVQIHPVEYETVALKNLREFDQRHYGSSLLIFYETVSAT